MATGNAIHAGSLVQTIGGIDNSTTIDDTTITLGINPLSGTVPDTVEGWEIHSTVSGSFSGSIAENPADSYDLFFQFPESICFRRKQVVIPLNFDNYANSNGVDAFAASKFGSSAKSVVILWCR